MIYLHNEIVAMNIPFSLEHLCSCNIVEPKERRNTKIRGARLAQVQIKSNRHLSAAKLSTLFFHATYLYLHTSYFLPHSRSSSILLRSQENLPS